MGKSFKGSLTASELKLGVVVARFNEWITGQLLAGALDAWSRHGGDEEALDVAWVPGSFEIPVVASRMAASGRYDAVVCLGAVIRGATSHYDHLASSVTSALLSIGVDEEMPVINAVLTVETIEQAIERAGSKAGNRGYDAVVAAIEMATLLRNLDRGLSSSE